MSTRLAFQLGLSAICIGTPLALLLFARIAARIDAMVKRHRRQWLKRNRVVSFPQKGFRDYHNSVRVR